jgi:hypothetical protein
MCTTVYKRHRRVKRHIYTLLTDVLGRSNGRSETGLVTKIVAFEADREQILAGRFLRRHLNVCLVDIIPARTWKQDEPGSGSGRQSREQVGVAVIMKKMWQPCCGFFETFKGEIVGQVVAHRTIADKKSPYRCVR